MTSFQRESRTDWARVGEMRDSDRTGEKPDGNRWMRERMEPLTARAGAGRANKPTWG